MRMMQKQKKLLMASDSDDFMECVIGFKSHFRSATQWMAERRRIH